MLSWPARISGQSGCSGMADSQVRPELLKKLRDLLSLAFVTGRAETLEVPDICSAAPALRHDVVSLERAVILATNLAPVVGALEDIPAHPFRDVGLLVAPTVSDRFGPCLYTRVR